MVVSNEALACVLISNYNFETYKVFSYIGVLNTYMNAYINWEIRFQVIRDKLESL